MAAIEVKTPSLTWIGNVLFGLACAFGVDTILIGGAVTKYLPDEIKFLIGFVIFIGVMVYGYKAAKRLN
jgi:hypothetical protein